MEQLFRNPTFRLKMSSLTSTTRRWFIASLVDLFEQESECVIDVIEDCREEMRETAGRLTDEAEELRAASQRLQEKRQSPDHCQKRSVSRVSGRGRLSSSCDRQGSTDSVLNRQRFRRRRIVGSEDDGYRSPENSSNRYASSVSFVSTPSLPSLASRISNSSSRSLPATPTVPTEQELADRRRRMEENMSSRESQAEKEREKQQERLERIRRQRRLLAEDRTQQALHLLEKALELDKMVAQEKEKHSKQLREKLDDIKRKKEQRTENKEQRTENKEQRTEITQLSTK